ncbi:septum formation initiator family protein [Candidatus Babeliales bacterium]|nr:septum formation initiator family protein [Candidatus Babeliales bacterium]MCF7899455.1 septum formation initiator family protein [Candidatus Babeliales bacterium]
MRLKTITRSLIFIFLYSFFLNSMIFSDIGILKYFEVKKEISEQQDKIIRLENKVRETKNKIAAWQEDDFYLEKMAREDLQMGYLDELIYIK